MTLDQHTLQLARQRRWVLKGTAGALAAAGLGSWTQGARAQAKPLPAFASWKDANSLIVHSTSTVETRRGAFGTGIVTPADRLYIRNNLTPPDASIVAAPDAWRVEVAGVAQPMTLSVGQLKSMGVETVAMVLQCSGNGRGFFPSKPSGTPWKVGAAGCVVWTGVPVRAVAAALGGVADGMRFMTGTGGEKLPEGVDANAVVVERSLPLGAMDDALLAWEMNGAPIPLAHGGPLRLVVPGYSGVNNIKYVKRLAFTAGESQAKIMSHGYRITPPGAKADPSQPSVLAMEVKSWIESPGADGGTVARGTTQIVGLAFGGARALKGVEVSIDGGQTWREAKLIGPDLGRYAWRQFVLQADLQPGSYTLASRATDAAGNVQPQQRMENTGGYNNNSWADHALKVTVA
ncbi:MAG: sulfite oxidase [Burkholderiales bacterium]|nr:sulfite oxidase [Burkholderiales bacterium]